MWIWPLRRVDSVVFVLCAKFGSNICYTHWDRCTLCFRLSFDDVTRINFRFWPLITWSSPHDRDASSHIIWCKISLSSPKLLTFFRHSRWRPPPSWIFRLCAFGHSGVLTVWYLCSVQNFVQISVIVTEIDAPMLQTFIWWHHANLLPVSTFDHVIFFVWPWCIFPPNLVQISTYPLHFTKFKMIAVRHCIIMSGRHYVIWNHPRRLIRGAYPWKISSWSAK